MKYKFFTVPIAAPESMEAALNSFCAGHRILHIEKHFVADGGSSVWAVCVTYLSEKADLSGKPGKRPRIDYKEVLNETDFQLFAKLREWRKRIAERDAVPPYTVFTNEQLAAIVQRRVGSKSELLQVEGIGPARVDKYALSLFECLRNETIMDKDNEASEDQPR